MCIFRLAGVLPVILPSIIIWAAYIAAKAIFSFQFGKRVSLFKGLQPLKSPVLTWLPAFIPAALTPIVCLIAVSNDFRHNLWDI